MLEKIGMIAAVLLIYIVFNVVLKRVLKKHRYFPTILPILSMLLFAMVFSESIKSTEIYSVKFFMFAAFAAYFIQKSIAEFKVVKQNNLSEGN